jgi:hypothetical protein
MKEDLDRFQALSEAHAELGTVKTELGLLRTDIEQLVAERDTARAALRALEQRVAEEAEGLDRQRWRADGLATAVVIALHELERGGIQPHTHALLVAASAAYETGKKDQEPAAAVVDYPMLDTKILGDIADWAARHGLTLTDAALTEALQRVRDVHHQRLFVEEQLAALGWRAGGVNDPALMELRRRERTPESQ